MSQLRVEGNSTSSSRLFGEKCGDGRVLVAVALRGGENSPQDAIKRRASSAALCSAPFFDRPEAAKLPSLKPPFDVRTAGIVSLQENSGPRSRESTSKTGVPP